MTSYLNTARVRSALAESMSQDATRPRLQRLGRIGCSGRETMSRAFTLSDAALALLRRRAGGERVPVTEETRPAYRELAAAGILVAGHSFALGRESVFKVTEAGWDF